MVFPASRALPTEGKWNITRSFAFGLALAAALLQGQTPLCSLPAATDQRCEVCLNGEWEFAKGQETSPPSEGWRGILVPGSFAGGMATGHRGWYRLGVPIPRLWNDGRKVALRFEAINYYAKLVVNGQAIAEHRSSLLPFEAEVTRALRFGERNELLLFVQDLSKDPETQAYHTEGMYWKNAEWGITKDVFVCCYPSVHLEDVFVVPSVRQKKLTVRVCVRNGSEHPQAVTVRNTAMLSGKLQLELPPVSLALQPGEAKTGGATKAWSNPTLWGFGDYGTPTLYFLRTGLLARRKPSAVTTHHSPLTTHHDEVFTRFGFREFWIEGKRFFLNGRPIFLQSITHGPDYHSRDFATHTLAAYRSANINLVRPSGTDYKAASVWFDVADEQGMLMKAMSFYAGRPLIEKEGQLREILTSWVRELRNHPSIVLWTVSNEVTRGEHDPEVWRHLARLASAMKDVDPTRPLEFRGEPSAAKGKQEGILPGLELYSAASFYCDRSVEQHLEEARRKYGYADDIPWLEDELYPGAMFVDDGTTQDFFARFPSVVFRAYREYGERLYRSILDCHRLGAAGAGGCISMGTLFLGVNQQDKVQLPFGVEQEGARVEFPVPSLSGRGSKVQSLGLNPQSGGPINWFDSRQPVYRTSVVHERVTEAFRFISGKDLPMPRTRAPEVVVVLSDNGKPVAGELVFLMPLAGQSANPVGVLTDREGTAWFTLQEGGRYVAQVANLGHTTGRTTIEVRMPPLSPKGGYEHLQWVALGDDKGRLETLRKRLAQPAGVVIPPPKPEAKEEPTMPKQLVGWWAVEGGDRCGLKDRSGAGGDGELHGPVCANAEGRWALQFDGVDDYAEIPHRPNLDPTVTNRLSVEVLVEPEAEGKAQALLYKASGGAMPDYQLGLNSANQLNFGMRLGGVYGGTGGYEPATKGKWRHLVATYDGKEVRLYVDGVADMVQFKRGTMKNSGGPLILGKPHLPDPAYGSPFKGLLAEARVYNYALSEDEVKGRAAVALGRTRE